MEKQYALAAERDWADSNIARGILIRFLQILILFTCAIVYTSVLYVATTFWLYSQIDRACGTLIENFHNQYTICEGLS